MYKGEEITEKLDKLKKIISGYKRALIAFSGGVDSTFLLAVAKEVLGEGVAAVNISAPWVPEGETSEANCFCEERGIEYISLSKEIEDIEGFAGNPKERCYICKKALFSALLDVAKDRGIDVVMEGSNVDDLSDYRPGMKALKELDIKSPLREAGLTKAEIRELSKELDLPTFDKPSMACLASRLVYGEMITKEKLSMVEMAEDFLRTLGFSQLRVRLHETGGSFLARIEVEPSKLEDLMSSEMRDQVESKLKKLGFDYVTVDIGGYRTGSMNVGIN